MLNFKVPKDRRDIIFEITRCIRKAELKRSKLDHLSMIEAFFWHIGFEQRQARELMEKSGRPLFRRILLDAVISKLVAQRSKRRSAFEQRHQHCACSLETAELLRLFGKQQRAIVEPLISVLPASRSFAAFMALEFADPLSGCSGHGVKPRAAKSSGSVRACARDP